MTVDPEEFGCFALGNAVVSQEFDDQGFLGLRGYLLVHLVTLK